MERANLVTQCLQKLHEVGVKVVALVCDGPSCHISMLTELGANMHADDLTTHFKHPVDHSRNVHVLLDICHMLKLVRNSFATLTILRDSENNIVSWKFIEELYKLQSEEGLHLANKLKKTHMQWRAQKMKENLAAQTLSSSVADALDFCRRDLQLKQFQESEATSNFHRIFDHLFDIFNSRNPFARNYKAPLRSSNQQFWKPFLEQSYDYIRGLRDVGGDLICSSRKKTGFLGFLCAIKSVGALFQDLIACEHPLLRYLLTYKLSQDHIELFFAAVRSSYGCNNNPTALQFRSAYKRMLVRHEISCESGNCRALDCTTTLPTLRSSTCPQLQQENAIIARRYDILLREPAVTDHDYADVPNMTVLSPFKEAVVEYIAGYVVKSVEKTTVCTECKVALRAPEEPCMESPTPSLVRCKDRGGVVKPSKCVIKTCSETEKCFQRMAKTVAVPSHPKIMQAIVSSVLLAVSGHTFNSLAEHMFDTEPINNHVILLQKCIILFYCKIRIYHIIKSHNINSTDRKVRKTYSKLVLFNHQ